MTGRYNENSATDKAPLASVRPSTAPSGRVSIGLARGQKIACVLQVVDETHWRVVPPEPIDPDDFASMTIDGIPEDIKLIYEYQGRVTHLK